MSQAHARSLAGWVLIASTIASTGCLLITKKNQGDAAPARIDPGPWAGPLAEKHAGKVVFSSAPIPMNGTDDSAAYAAYTLGEPLFMRYWGADSPHNLQACNMRSMSLRSSSFRKLRLYADVNGAGAGLPPEKLTPFGWYDVSEERVKERGMNSLSNELDNAFTAPSKFSGDPGTAGEATVRSFNTNIIPMLHDGENTLRIVVALACDSGAPQVIVAEGAVPVRVPPGALAAYKAKYAPRLEPSPHPENDKLAREIVAVMKKKADWDNEIFVGASVTSEAWEPVRNPDTGVLIAYQIDALLFARLKKEPDQDKCRAFRMSYRKDPAGGTLYYAGTGTNQSFPCSAAPH